MKSSSRLRRAAFALLALSATLRAEPEPIDAIAAVVNDSVILESDVEQRLRQTAEQLQASGTGLPPLDVLRRQVLERLILGELQVQIAQQSGVQVDDEQLARAIRNIAQGNNLSVPEFRRAIAAEGMDYEVFREDLRRQLIITRLKAQRVTNSVRVTDEEIERFLAQQAGAVSGRESFHLRHILIATPDGASSEEIEQARTRAEEILARLRGGADFAEVAVSESDSQTALDGGDLGWLESARVPTLFSSMVNQLERGQLGDLIRSPSGFHIVLLEDYRGGDRQIVVQNHVRQILIRTNELVSDDDARNALEQLRLRALGGEDFGALARAHSDDSATAIAGGDLGWRNPADLLPEFLAQVNNLEPGDVSEPFRTGLGWQLVELLGRRDFDNTVEATREIARRAILERKGEEALERWLRELRDEAYVEVRI
ncbi:MAG: peptidylprolyl isomerase [Chromatiales bacterium]|nr:peptidylprolyl isomerase [Chromatiales bacterium]